MAKTKTLEQELADCEDAHRKLAKQLADLGYIMKGSVTRRYNRCGKSNCSCKHDPPVMHGPYYQWTATQDGKTANKQLTPHQAKLYKKWTRNNQKAKVIIAKMQEIAAKAIEITLKDEQ